MTKVHLPSVIPTKVSWNKGRTVGQITQSKTGHPVQFEVGELSRKAIGARCALPTWSANRLGPVR